MSLTEKAELEKKAQEGAWDAGNTVASKASALLADPDPNAANAPANFLSDVGGALRSAKDWNDKYTGAAVGLSDLGSNDASNLDFQTTTSESLPGPAGGVLASGEAAGQPVEKGPGYVKWTETPLVTPGEAGTGKGGLSGSVTGTVGPQVPGEYTTELMAYLGRSADLEQLGLQARADFFRAEVDILNDLLPLWEADYEGTKKQVGAILDEAEQETQAIGDLIQAAQSDQINPGQFFANIGDAGKFSAAIAVGAGAMASVFAGGPNVAYNIISTAIDRNVRAQVINQQHNRALIGHQANFVNLIRGLGKDRMLYGNYLRLGLTAIAQTKIGMARAGLNSGLSHLAAQDVHNKLGAALAQARIQAITASQQKVTFKFKSMQQYAQAMKALGAQGGQARGNAAGGAGASPAAAGMNRRKPAQPQVTADAMNLSGNPDQIAAEMADAMKNKVAAEGLTPQQVNQLRNQKVAELEQGNDTSKAVAAKLKGMGKESLLPVSQTATVPVTIAGEKYAARPDERFLALTGKGPSDAISAVQNAGTMLEYGKEMHKLLGITNFNSPHAALQHLKVFGDERLLMPANSPEAREIFNRLSTLAIRVQEMGRASGNTRNAINTLPEMAREATRQGQHVSALQHIYDWFQKDPELRQASFEGILPFLEDDFAAAQNAMGLQVVKE